MAKEKDNSEQRRDENRRSNNAWNTCGYEISDDGKYGGVKGLVLSADDISNEYARLLAEKKQIKKSKVWKIAALVAGGIATVVVIMYFNQPKTEKLIQDRPLIEQGYQGRVLEHLKKDEVISKTDKLTKELCGEESGIISGNLICVGQFEEKLEDIVESSLTFKEDSNKHKVPLLKVSVRKPTLKFLTDFEFTDKESAEDGDAFLPYSFFPFLGLFEDSTPTENGFRFNDVQEYTLVQDCQSYSGFQLSGQKELPKFSIDVVTYDNQKKRINLAYNSLFLEHLAEVLNNYNSYEMDDCKSEKEEIEVIQWKAEKNYKSITGSERLSVERKEKLIKELNDFLTTYVYITNQTKSQLSQIDVNQKKLHLFCKCKTKAGVASEIISFLRNKPDKHKIEDSDDSIKYELAGLIGLSLECRSDEDRGYNGGASIREVEKNEKTYYEFLCQHSECVELGLELDEEAVCDKDLVKTDVVINTEFLSEIGLTTIYYKEWTDKKGNVEVYFDYKERDYTSTLTLPRFAAERLIELLDSIIHKRDIDKELTDEGAIEVMRNYLGTRNLVMVGDIISCTNHDFGVISGLYNLVRTANSIWKLSYEQMDAYEELHFKWFGSEVIAFAFELACKVKDKDIVRNAIHLGLKLRMNHGYDDDEIIESQKLMFYCLTDDNSYYTEEATTANQPTNEEAINVSLQTIEQYVGIAKSGLGKMAEILAEKACSRGSVEEAVSETTKTALMFQLPRVKELVDSYQKDGLFLEDLLTHLAYDCSFEDNYKEVNELAEVYNSDSVREAFETFPSFTNLYGSEEELAGYFQKINSHLGVSAAEKFADFLNMDSTQKVSQTFYDGLFELDYLYKKTRCKFIRDEQKCFWY